MHQQQRGNEQNVDNGPATPLGYVCATVMTLVTAWIVMMIFYEATVGPLLLPWYLFWSPLSCSDDIEGEAQLALNDSCMCLYRLLRERLDDCNGVRESAKDRVSLNHPDRDKLKVPREPWDFGFPTDTILIKRYRTDEDGTIYEMQSMRISWLGDSLQHYLNQTQDLTTRYRLYILERARIHYVELTQRLWYWVVNWLKYFRLIPRSYDMCECPR